MEKDLPTDRSNADDSPGNNENDKDVIITDSIMTYEVRISSLKLEIAKNEREPPKTIEEKEKRQNDLKLLKQLKNELSALRRSAVSQTSSTSLFANLPLPNVSTGKLLDIFNDPGPSRQQSDETEKSSKDKFLQIEDNENARKQSPFLSNLLDKKYERTDLAQFMNPPPTEQADSPSTSGLSNVAGSSSSSEDSSYTSGISPGERDDSPITRDETLPSQTNEPKPSTSYAADMLELELSKSNAGLENRSPIKGSAKYVGKGKAWDRNSPKSSPVKAAKQLHQDQKRSSSESLATDSPINPSQEKFSPTESKALEVENQSPKGGLAARNSPAAKRKILTPKEKDYDESCTGISTDSQLSETQSYDEIKIFKKLKFEDDENESQQFPTLTEERQSLDLPNTGVLSNVAGFTSISISEESFLTSGSGEIILGEREDSSSLTNVSDTSHERDDSPITSVSEETSTSGNSESQQSQSIDMSPRPMDEIEPVTNMEL